MVTVFGSMIAGPLGGATPVPGVRKAYLPVKKEYRVGVHVDAEQ